MKTLDFAMKCVATAIAVALCILVWYRALIF